MSLHSKENRSPKRVVCFVARSHGLACLQALVESSEYDVVCAFTHRRNPKSEDPNREDREDYKQFEACAKAANIPLHCIDSKGESEKVDGLLAEVGAFDFLISVSWRRIIPPRQLKLAEVASINLHRGKLPDFAGTEPIKRALERGDSQVEITAHIMEEEVDSGEVLATVSHPVLPKDSTIDQRVEELKVAITPLFAPLMFEAIHVVAQDRKDPVIVFDLDGVLVDSLEGLYQVYCNFLKRRGIEGSRTEFDRLNGPSLEECVQYLKDFHKLDEDTDVLLREYLALIENIPSEVPAVPGAMETLDALHKDQTTLALASSANRKYIQSTLKRFNIEDRFQLVVSGDDVQHSKPDPDIYMKVKRAFGTHQMFVVEDSENGVKSALGAGLGVFHFKPTGKPGEASPAWTLDSLERLPALLPSLKHQTRPMVATQAVRLKYRDVDYRPHANQKNAIDACWKSSSEGRFDGTIASVFRMDFQDSTLEIEVIRAQYRHSFYQQCFPESDLGVRPLAVSGILVDPHGNTLVAERQGVTEYEGFYELVPSGGVDLLRLKGGTLSYENAILDELEQETGIERTQVARLTPLGVVYDTPHRMYDLCCRLELKVSLSEIMSEQRTSEYKNFKIVPFKDVGMLNEKMVPASEFLMGTFAPLR